MAFWPFGRKRRRNSKAKSDTREAASELKRQTPAASASRGQSDGDGDKRVTSTPDRDRRGRLSDEKDVAALEFQQGTLEKLPMSRGSVEDITALPLAVRRELRRSSHWRPIGRQNSEFTYDFEKETYIGHLDEGQQGDRMQPARGLGSKRAAPEPAMQRRQSSKKRRDERAHEKDTRQLTSATKHPTIWGVGGPSRGNSKRTREEFDKRFDRRGSNLSFTLADSVHTSMGVPYDEHAFNVRNIFSPRPTIRYSGTLHQSRPGTAMSSGMDKRPRPSKEILAQSRTIDELADDLDAGGLRALMDRDQKRRDKKYSQDEERMRRRLQRKADKQRAEQERTAEYMALRKSKSRELATNGEEVAGLGIQTSPSAVPEVPKVLETTETLGTVNTGTYLYYPPKGPIPLPPKTHGSSLADVGSLRSYEQTPWEDTPPFEEPVIITAQEIRYSQASVSVPTSPKYHTRDASNLFNLVDLRETPDIPDKSPKRAEQVPDQPPEQLRSLDRDSVGSNSRGSSPWLSIFRRGGTAKRASQDRGKPSPAQAQASFSNTSRESVSRQPLPAHLQQKPMLLQSLPTTPIRTQSRFREDLPESPMSPSESRLQSPVIMEAEPTSRAAGFPGFPTVVPQGSFEGPPSQTNQPPGPLQTAASALMSESLASVDSEGSWLSGRPSKRPSSQTLVPPVPPLPVPSVPNTLPSPPPPGEGEEFIRYGPLSDQRTELVGFTPRESDLEGLETGSEPDPEESPIQARDTAGQTLVHEGVDRMPTVIRRDDTHKSREGLLNDVHDGEASQYDSSPHEEITEKDAVGQHEPATKSAAPLPKLSTQDSTGLVSADSGEHSPAHSSEYSVEPGLDQATVELRRAKSVDFSPRHARKAGSAKLLDIPARTGSVSSPTTPRLTPDKRSSATTPEPVRPTAAQGP